MKLRNRLDLRIPINKIEEGAELCLSNAMQFCSDAENLVDTGSNEHALGLCVLATEEVGKAIMLKEKAMRARKRSESEIFLGWVSPEVFFHVTAEQRKRMGFTKKKIHPFYHHLAKFLWARNARQTAIQSNVMYSLSGKMYKNSDEMNKTEKELWAYALKANVTNPDIREILFYVDYDMEKGEWRRATDVDSARAKRMITR
jgi:hypothetical protein